MTQCSTISALRRKSRAGGRAANGVDSLLHFRDDGLEQAGALGAGLYLLPFAVPLFGQVDDLGFQLHDLPSVGS